MRLRWLIPLGLATAGVVGLVVKRKVPGLGRTSRLGPRTGAIEVDDEIVEDRVEEALSTFESCNDEANTIKPQRHPLAMRFVTVRDAATGGGRNVRVKMKPISQVAYSNGTARLVQDSRTPLTIELMPNINRCLGKDYWRQKLQQWLAHEMAHASDPLIFKRTNERRKDKSAINMETEEGYRQYVNQPEEMNAQLVEVQKQLQRQGGGWRSDPINFLRRSERFSNLEPVLTPANKKRFMKLAARLKTQREELAKELRKQR